MADIASPAAEPAVRPIEGERAQHASLPWFVWCCALAITSGSVGIVWDIAWHKSIGRDTFWTPPHIAIYLNGVLAGAASAYMILATTAGRLRNLRDVSVGMWGFRGPLGAFVCAWGGVAMLTSAPFDDWWHNAYGLDVKVLSPPHFVLFLGVMAIRLGTFLLLLGLFNRALARGERVPRSLDLLLTYSFALLMTASIGLFQEFEARPFLHSGLFYLVVCIFTPVWLEAAPEVFRTRWAATKVSATFMLIFLLPIWILPLAPAEPKLGPVYQPVTHLLPPDFPLLLIAPGLALDLLRPRLRGLHQWTRAAIAGIVFLAAFLAAQWPFANFLITPAARNWLFGANNLPYFVPPQSDYARYVFTRVEASTAQFAARMAMALVAAAVSARLGLLWGRSLIRLRR